MNWAQAAPYAILGLALTIPGWRKLIHTLRATRRAKAPAPAASPRPVPDSPGAGAAAGPAKPANPLAGGPGTGLYGRCVMTIYLYDTGISVAFDHDRRRRPVHVPPADQWDGCGWLKDTAP